MAQVEVVHGIGAQAADTGVGEMQYLVVVEHHDRSLLHDEAVQLAVEAFAAHRVRAGTSLHVEAVELLVAEVGIVGAGRSSVGAVE